MLEAHQPKEGNHLAMCRSMLRKMHRTHLMTLTLMLGAIACGSLDDAEPRLGASDAALLAPIDSAPAVFCPGPPILNLIRHCGNVTINGQAEADQFAHIQTIVGNLTIHAGSKKVGTTGAQNVYDPTTTFSMPDLKLVTGNVIIDTDHVATASLAKLATIGGDLTVKMNHFLVAVPPNSSKATVSVLETPALTTIGGNIELDGILNYDIAGIAHTFDFGLDHVTSLKGNVRVSVPTNGRAAALNGLTTIKKSVSITWPGPNDLIAPKLLSNATAVAEDVTVYGASYMDKFMSKLTSIGGTLTVTTANPMNWLRGSAVFTALSSIGKDLVLNRAGAYWCTTTALANLTQVVGQIRIIDSDLAGRIGKSGLSAGGIEIAGSHGTMPFFPDLQLTAVAKVSVHDNPDLCQCFVDELQQNLTTHGWSGLVASSGNGTCSTCTDCSP
jgi:hypothetical protein